VKPTRKLPKPKQIRARPRPKEHRPLTYKDLCAATDKIRSCAAVAEAAGRGAEYSSALNKSLAPYLGPHGGPIPGILDDLEGFLPRRITYDAIGTLREPNVADALAHLYYLAHHGKGQLAHRALRLLRRLLPKRPRGKSPDLREDYIRFHFRRERARVNEVLSPKNRLWIRSELEKLKQRIPNYQERIAVVRSGLEERIKRKAPKRTPQGRLRLVMAALSSPTVYPEDVECALYGKPDNRPYAIERTASVFGITPREVRKRVADIR
jgi:hypothetical protein